MPFITPDHIEQFLQNGYLKIENAFSAELANECLSILWKKTKCNPDDPTTWTEPVIRLGEQDAEAFKKTANTDILIEVYDTLAGKGNWLPKESVGSFPIRFPSNKTATDTGWHVDASFPGNDLSDYLQWRINIHSKGRALLMLFLYSDVSELDGPTKIKIGSHKDVANFLEPEGEQGLSFIELSYKLNALPNREEAIATGKAGTVYVCHPFIVHAAQEVKGTKPKFMAQPALLTKNDFNIYRDSNCLCPIERAILMGCNKS